MDLFNIVKYFKDKAELLASEFNEQIKINDDINLGDYLTEDIANEWLDEDVSLLQKLVNENNLNKDILYLYELINKNFIDVSENGKLFDENIWTLNALKNHVFWKEQRLLAKKLVNKLKELQ